MLLFFTKEFFTDNIKGVIMSNRFVKASFLMLTAFLVTIFGFDAKTGDIWVNGEFSFLSTGRVYKYENKKLNRYLNNNSERANQINLSSAVRFFLFEHLCLGPRISWEGFNYTITDEFFNFFELNGELGLVGVSNAIYPYLLVSPGFQFSENISRFVFPFSAGLMLPINEHLGLQFEFGVKLAFEEYHTDNTISIGIGICGFGKKSAISILNQFKPN